MDEGVQQVEHENKRARGPFSIAWRVVVHLFTELIELGVDSVYVIMRELRLFLGLALVTVGLLNFESDKYCDGNTADYLSCTRPSTYYYFDSVDITFVVLGIFLIVLWFLSRQR